MPAGKRRHALEAHFETFLREVLLVTRNIQHFADLEIEVVDPYAATRN